MALLLNGCSPKPDGILSQVQEESKSPFFLTSGHVSRYTEYPGVHHHPEVLSLVCADTVHAEQSKHLETCTIPGWGVVTSLVPSQPLDGCPLCKTKRPLP